MFKPLLVHPIPRGQIDRSGYDRSAITDRNTVHLLSTLSAEEERVKLRALRKERASKFIENQHQGGGEGVGANSSKSGRAVTRTNLATSHYIWYLSVGIPAGLLFWGFNDENSPPAQFCRVTGITAFIRSYTDELAKPVYDKLLPDWSEVTFVVFR